MYGQRICKRKDYTMNIGTMTTIDSRSPEKYITDEYRYENCTRNTTTAAKKVSQRGCGATTTWAD